MTVESNYVIAIATLSDCLKSRASFSTNEKQNQNQSHHVRVIFRALRAGYRCLLGIVIGFIALFVPVVIGRSNCFGFGFSTVI